MMPCTAFALVGALCLFAGLYVAAIAIVRAGYRRGETLDVRTAQALRRTLDDGQGPPLRVVPGGKGRR